MKQIRAADSDIHVDDLRKLIQRLQEHVPLTDNFESGLSAKVWYRSQKEHLNGWLRGYNGPGAYGRKHPSTSGKQAYNHLRCAPALLWLAEALGEESEVLERAIDGIRGAGSNPSSQCAAFRRIVPWSRIVELAAAYPPPTRRRDRVETSVMSIGRKK